MWLCYGCADMLQAVCRPKLSTMQSGSLPLEANLGRRASSTHAIDLYTKQQQYATTQNQSLAAEYKALYNVAGLACLKL